jgi:hypothetical protein
MANIARNSSFLSLRRNGVAVLLLLAAVALGCKMLGGGADSSSNNTPSNSAPNSTAPNSEQPTPNEDGTIPSGTGVEKQKPAPGKANVQGKAFYNDKPAVGVEVKLCKTFSQFVNGCGGKTYTAKTDEAGEYLIADVEPGVYEGLTVQVFDTPYYVFATSGFISAAKYDLEEGKTYFAPDTHLFKSDIKLVSPKAGSKVPVENLEVKWEPYPDAAYYKVSLYGDESTGAKTETDYINKRIDGDTMAVDKPLQPGEYKCKIDAFNANDRKLAQSPDDLKFTVTGAK